MSKLDLLTPRQLARQSGWPEHRIRALIARRALRHIRIGGNFFIPSGALEEYVAENMVDPAAPSSRREAPDAEA